MRKNVNYQITFFKENNFVFFKVKKLDFIIKKALEYCRDINFPTFEYTCDFDLEFTDISKKK